MNDAVVCKVALLEMDMELQIAFRVDQYKRNIRKLQTH